MKLPTQYQTRFERMWQWLEENDADAAFYGAALIAAFLLVDFLAGGILT